MEKVEKYVLVPFERYMLSKNVDRREKEDVTHGKRKEVPEEDDDDDDDSSDAEDQDMEDFKDIISRLPKRLRTFALKICTPIIGYNIWDKNGYLTDMPQIHLNDVIRDLKSATLPETDRKAIKKLIRSGALPIRLVSIRNPAYFKL